MTHQTDAAQGPETPDPQPGTNTDPVTGLPGRRQFLKRVADVLAGRPDRRWVPAILAIGFDEFARVSDTFGYAVGDMLLQRAATRLCSAVQPADVVTRTGESDFAILLLGPRERISAAAPQLVEVLGQPYLLGGRVVNAGASLGAAIALDTDHDAANLHRCATLALSLARAEGHGQVRFFDPTMAACASARQALEFDLRKALSLRQLELFYQPQINLATGRLSGFEALLRWRHPTRGLVAPDDFIPIAEETGLIVAIGEWVLRTACHEATRWPDDVTVAVNVATAQFAGGRLMGVVEAALAASGLPHRRLEIEVTEGVLLRQGGEVAQTLHALHGAGVRISMDDFGTGFSSMTQIKAFPFDKIKIDRSLVADIGHDPSGAVFVRAITTLSAGLGMQTVVEGIETAAQMEQVRAEGCTEAQGFLISRPIPAGEIPELIAKLRALPPIAVARLRLVA